MASWMIHLRVADYLIDRFSGLDTTAFVVGSIAPDSGVPSEDWSSYTPSKPVSHFKSGTGSESFYDVDRFVRQYFTAEQVQNYTGREYSFFLGYYVHLLTDVEWAAEIVRPAMAEYAGRTEEEKNAFIWEMKRDWYDLDFRYLEEHPDFRAFLIYEQAEGFRNDFMDIFSRDALDSRRQYICAYYRGKHGELYREYPFLTPARADAFVDGTTEKIRLVLESMPAVREKANSSPLR